MDNYKIILASASPRRKQIMERMGIPFQVMAADVEEKVSETDPSRMVQALATLKTEAVLSKLLSGYVQSGDANKVNGDSKGNKCSEEADKNKDSEDNRYYKYNKDNKDYKGRHNFIIIGADTMVFYNGQAFGKPKDEADAFRTLRILSGNSHEVISGVSIIINDSRQKRLSFTVTTKVMMQNLTDEQIRAYIAAGEPMDKAGAYAIQGQFGIYIREIIGDYYNVVGFPIAKIYEVLLNLGIDLKKQG